MMWVNAKSQTKYLGLLMNQWYNPYLHFRASIIELLRETVFTPSLRLHTKVIH